MPGRRRGARSGRGWDAAPPRPPRGGRSVDDASASGSGRAAGEELVTGYAPLWTPEEDQTYARGHAGGSGSSRADVSPGDTSRDGAFREDEPRGAAGRRSGDEARPEVARDPAERAREICLQLLAVRPRTRQELATAMRRRGIADDVAAAVLDRYDEVGLIDDAAFARAWVTSRHHGKGLASRALAGELRRKGLDGEVVGEALAELDSDTEAATARVLVDRKLRGMGSVAPDAVFRRLVGMLARKGYPPGMAVRVVKEALADRDESAREYADMIDADALADLADGDESNLSGN